MEVIFGIPVDDAPPPDGPPRPKPPWFRINLGPLMILIALMAFVLAMPSYLHPLLLGLLAVSTLSLATSLGIVAAACLLVGLGEWVARWHGRSRPDERGDLIPSRPVRLLMDRRRLFRTPNGLMALVAVAALAIAFREILMMILAFLWGLVALVVVGSLALFIGVILPLGIVLECLGYVFGWDDPTRPKAGKKGKDARPVKPASDWEVWP